MTNQTAKNRLAIFLTVIALLVYAVFAQPAFAEGTGVSLAAEIQNMERTASRQGVSPEERHNALVRLARLRQLSGDIEGAAKNWLEAAAAIPGKVDDDALLACAYCLAAMGEWDRARTALEPLLSKSERARFLDISINAISTGNTSALAEIADNPEYSQVRGEIYYILWRTSTGPAAERWRQRLAAELPQSPEGRLAAGEASAAVAIKPSPFWLLIGGLDSLALVDGGVTSRPAQAAVTQTNPPAAQIASVSQQPSSQSAASQTRLQTGLFSRQANAQAQVTSLRQAGFSPSIEQRLSNGSEMWAVTVPSGADTNRTIADLKNAGFESFPLR